MSTRSEPKKAFENLSPALLTLGQPDATDAIFFSLAHRERVFLTTTIVDCGVIFVS